MSYRALVVSLFAIVVVPPSARAVEPWADKQLAVTDGLQVWLDASRINAAAAAHRHSLRRHGDVVAIWYDASGKQRDFVQHNQPQRPTYNDELIDDKTPALEFDGEDDGLLLPSLGEKFREITVFLVAAPRANPGLFRAFFACNRQLANDYVTGLTIDQGGFPGSRFNAVNVEGIGFGGAQNLMNEDFSLGTFHVLSVTSQPGAAGVRLFVDGKANGQRDRGPDLIAADEMRVGVRYYSNTPIPAFEAGNLHGAIAELLVYDRALPEDQRQQVEKYLAEKYAGLMKVEPKTPQGRKKLVAVPNPPAVQMLVPGYSSQELPVQLSNVNNLRYRPDGKLLALAYNGDILLLSDTDGDGLEDRSELWWDNQGRIRGPIGMCLTPPDYPHGSGVFVASKGKVSLIVDRNRDNRADEEQVIASGWQELPHGVDALGVAIDAQGQVFFGLGAGDFTNAYQIGKDGKSRYDLSSERGTILQVSPDLKSRQIYCTGIRFPVGLAFNAAGDLFCTDQEGATWLANGNPFDELLHVQRDRHYGFPPQHPKHLPTVIDEPSTYDYGPQHQSTCGLTFNEPVGGGPSFGPAWWRGDALVTGYSRGKLYRTKLVKSETGYVAQNQLLACFNMLSADVCVSPRGDLIVAQHSGGPDWGSGPNGNGKLFRIRRNPNPEPQPVWAWSSSPHEVRVAFDQPLHPEQFHDWATQASIDFGPYVSPGDRFESLRPGYEAVQQQLANPRFDMPIHGISITADRRGVVVATNPHSAAMRYALTLPNSTDVAYDLSGVLARWTPAGGSDADSISTSLPHLDLTVARSLTVGSSDHDLFWERIKQPGRLVLQTKLDLWQLLQPAVQPGSKLDHVREPEDAFVEFTANCAAWFDREDEPTSAALRQPGNAPFKSYGWRISPREKEPISIAVTLATGSTEPQLQLRYSTSSDQRRRPLPAHRMLLPWAAPQQNAVEPTVREAPPELAGGDWLRGRDLFFSEQAQCAKCHAVHGRGGEIGPSLSNLRHRDYGSVLRDITQPNFAINPDFVSYSIELDDGRVFNGTVRTIGEQLRIGDNRGSEVVVARSSVEQLRPQAISTMPDGLLAKLPTEQVKDLLTFLLLAPPEELQPAPIQRPGAPAPRTRGAVDAILAGSEKLDPKDLRPLHIVLVSGPKDHGENEHDYPDWQKRWTKLFSLADKVKVTTAFGWPKPEDFASADVLVMYSANPDWAPERAKELDEFQARGGGLVLMHYAVNGQRAPNELAERIGLAWQGGRSKFRHGELSLQFPKDAAHPIARNFEKADFIDESYWELVGDSRRVTVLATQQEEGAARPMLWTYERGKGRVFVSILGHYSWTFDDPLFRALILRAIAWSANQPVDRFNELITLGARS